MEISLARFLRVIISQRSVCEAARVAQSFFSSLGGSPRRLVVVVSSRGER